MQQKMDRNNTSFPRKLYVSLKKYLEAPSDSPLQFHQRLAEHFFTNSDQRGLLIFHGTGTGKTMLAVAIADKLKNAYDVVIISAKSLKSNFVKEVEKYNKLKGEVASDEYSYVSLNSSNLMKQLQSLDKNDELVLLEKEYGVDSRINLDNKLVIVDEAQNFFNGVVSGSTGANSLYNAIMGSKNIRLLFLSATPIINDPFEVVPMFNMLAGESIFPDDYEEFHALFISGKEIINKERFKNRIYGLISYMGDWWKSESGHGILKRENFPDEMPTIVERIPMSSEQFSAYAIARDQETQVKKKKTTVKESMHKPKSDPSSSYRVQSRQISNFLFPSFAKEKKPSEFNKGFLKYVERITSEELTNPKLKEIYSPKMALMLERITQHPGLSVVYSSFVEGEGLRIFSEVLKHNGWEAYGPGEKTKKRFAFLTGNIDARDRQQTIDVFNTKANQFGRDIDCLLISGASAEGIDLRNVMSIHIMEPFWNYGRIAQVKARAIRYKSHEDYAPEDRKVYVYIYLSDYPVGYVPEVKDKKREAPQTTDVHLFFKSLKNKILIDKFYAAMVESSFDCSIHRESAPVGIREKIKCLTCLPTNKKLYYPNFKEELMHGNPCEESPDTKLNVKPVNHDGTEYYASIQESPANIYGKVQAPIVKIFKHDEELDAYTELSREDESFEHIMEQVVEMEEYKDAKITGGWQPFNTQ